MSKIESVKVYHRISKPRVWDFTDKFRQVSKRLIPVLQKLFKNLERRKDSFQVRSSVPELLWYLNQTWIQEKAWHGAACL